MIADELKHQFDITLDKKKIHLEHPIKTLGEYEVELRLHAEVKSTLKVRVESLTPVTAPVAKPLPSKPHGKTRKRRGKSRSRGRKSRQGRQSRPKHRRLKKSQGRIIPQNLFKKPRKFSVAFFISAKNFDRPARLCFAVPKWEVFQTVFIRSPSPCALRR